jgi:ferredoxin-type protein NapH
MASKITTPRRQRLRKSLILVSFLLFPITIYYFSPALIISGARSGVINGSFIMFGILLLSGLVLGRAWCAWACPGGGLGEICLMAGNRKAPGGRLDWIKWALWFPWLAAIAALAIKAGGYHTIDPFFMTYHGISVHDTPSYIVYFGFVALIAGLAFWPGRRGFCHYVCWMAPFIIIGMKLQRLGHWPALHLEANPDECMQCGTCAGNCPMSLDVPALVAKGDMFHNECILCGTCADNCEKKIIRFKMF